MHALAAIMGWWCHRTSPDQQVLEGNTPNVDVTAPGAILALAMMYLQSNNEAVAARLAPPATHFALEFVRPDFILLRVLACSLILWDSVQPSEEWVAAQVPRIIRTAAAATGGGEEERGAGENEGEGGVGKGAREGGGEGEADVDEEAMALALCNVLAGCCLSIGESHHATCCLSIGESHHATCCLSIGESHHATCCLSIGESHHATCCLSIGLRYAGSANGEAEKLLRSYALLFFFLRERRPLTAVACPFAVPLLHWRALLDACTLDTAVNAAVLSLSLVMAGTGHLPSLRLLRFFHRRTAAAADAAAVNAATTYGSHMAVSMAIGFLGLSACQATFSTSPPAVAALLLALFPHFPSSPADHRCHLQALRHFWVLAVEERAFVEAVDVDTWQPVIAPLHLTLKPSDSSTPTALSLHTPCLLPPLPQLRELRLCGGNFWPLRVAARIADSSHPSLRAMRGRRRGGHGAVAAGGGGGRKAVGSAMGAGVGGEGSGGRHLVLLVKGRGAQAGSGGGAAAVGRTGDPRSRMGELPPVSARSMAAALPVADPVLSAFHRLFCRPLPRSAVQPHATSSHEGFSSACQAALLMAHAAEQPELLEVLLSLATTCQAVRSLHHSHTTCGSALPCLVSSFQVLEAFIPSLRALSSPTLSHRASPPQSPIVSPLFLRSLCSTLHRHLLAPAHRTRSHSTSPLLRQHLEDYSRRALLLWRQQEQQASDLAGAATAAEASGSMSRPLADTTQEQPGSQLFPLILLAFAFPSPLSLGRALHTAMASCSPPASAASTHAPLSPPLPLPLLLALLLPHLRQHSAVMAMLLEVVQNLR
ncbi:unnamed protein product [Closterium sp. NIES-64]|nr:unnamed protein product [Closterium sp. NIES-64]